MVTVLQQCQLYQLIVYISGGTVPKNIRTDACMSNSSLWLLVYSLQIKILSLLRILNPLSITSNRAIPPKNSQQL